MMGRLLCKASFVVILISVPFSLGFKGNPGQWQMSLSDDGQISRREALETAAGASFVAGGSLFGPKNRAEAAIDADLLQKWSPPGKVLPFEAYTQLGGEMPTCRVLNGMWQVSGGHGFQPKLNPAIANMERLVEEGFTTFDAADIYGPAEQIVGAFRKKQQASYNDKCQFFTKWVPRPQKVTRALVEKNIGNSQLRMGTERIDLLQFHWWDYSDKNYQDALYYLQELSDEGTIRHLALTNFDTKHLKIACDNGANIVSNQVQYSVLDQRPTVKMEEYCLKNDVQILAYGTVLGGFLTEKWLGKPEPTENDLTTSSLYKYYYMIRRWGSWSLFQDLLVALGDIAQKHKVSIANVGVRWVLQQPAVGGAIVGVRLGYSEHIADTKKLFNFALDIEDLVKIETVTSRANPLFDIIGDCGDEYRRRA
mmetsp:Transcript_12635/g.16594  ORF Transcript_12635/g.16594 Transcript_12635/m.16594 type:complete len:423 (-) Transcript_12635:284-1552(-)